MNTLVIAAEGDLVRITPREEISDRTRQLAASIASLMSGTDRIVFCSGGIGQARQIETVLDDAREANMAPGSPLNDCIAMSEAFLSFNLAQPIEKELASSGRSDVLPVVGMLTQVTSKDGPFVNVLEMKALQSMLADNRFVIAGVSGGIPVEHTTVGWQGVDKPHDLNLTAASIADGVEANCLLIALGEQDSLPAGPYTAQKAEQASQNESLSPNVRSALHAASVFLDAAPDRKAVLVPWTQLRDALTGKAGLVVS